MNKQNFIAAEVQSEANSNHYSNLRGHVMTDGRRKDTKKVRYKNSVVLFGTFFQCSFVKHWLTTHLKCDQRPQPGRHCFHVKGHEPVYSTSLIFNNLMNI